MLILLEKTLLSWLERKKKKGAGRCLCGWYYLLASLSWPSLGYGLCKYCLFFPLSFFFFFYIRKVSNLCKCSKVWHLDLYPVHNFKNDKIQIKNWNHVVIKILFDTPASSPAYRSAALHIYPEFLGVMAIACGLTLSSNDPGLSPLS